MKGSACTETVKANKKHSSSEHKRLRSAIAGARQVAQQVSLTSWVFSRGNGEPGKLPFMLGFTINMTQTKITRERGTSIDKLLSSHWPVALTAH